MNVFLDYAGGYGLFVRMMRDKGFNYYWNDKYCENLFSKYWSMDRKNQIDKYELLSAFEVFEHLDNPLEAISEMFNYSDSILFSTEICKMKNVKNWWYLSCESGQHISFYSISSLEKLSEIFKCFFYSNGSSLHLMTKKYISKIKLSRYFKENKAVN